MAIRNIKEIINNKGYVIKPEDRKIFEQGDLQSFFGFSRTDAIEFIIYDANDNQLPQLNGELVRYVNLSDENIRDYFLIPEGTLIQQNSLPTEYFIDVERLLNEAGYSNGIFKTQVSLVNKRAGSEKQFDKLWIQEISPSRSEVRLFPLKKGVETNEELQERYNIFVNNGEFREDTLQAAFEIIEKIDPTQISNILKNKYGQEWLNVFIDEFKIADLQKFITEIHTTFVKSATYEFTNRYSSIKNLLYSKPKETSPSISLSKKEIEESIKRILIETVLYYLPERDITEKTTSVEEFDASEDEVGQILQTETEDTQINPTNVETNTTTQTSEGNTAEEYFIQEESGNKNTETTTADDEPNPPSGGSGGGGTGGGPVGGEGEQGNPVVGGGTSDGNRNDGSFVNENNNRRNVNIR
jgi:hypothetical protein